MAKFNPSASWNRYASQYVNNANAATQETAAQTGLAGGGYGNTYGSNAAGQAQDNYLAKLYNNYGSIYGTTDKNQSKKNQVNSDALWSNYADQYIRQGRQSMRDTLGQYQAQTGGYGNSLATGAAATAYYDYLDTLNGNWTKNSPKTSSGKSKKKTTSPSTTPIFDASGMDNQTGLDIINLGEVTGAQPSVTDDGHVVDNGTSTSTSPAGYGMSGITSDMIQGWQAEWNKTHGGGQ